MIRFESQQAAVEQIFSQRMGAVPSSAMNSYPVVWLRAPGCRGSASTDAPMRGKSCVNVWHELTLQRFFSLRRPAKLGLYRPLRPAFWRPAFQNGYGFSPVATFASVLMHSSACLRSAQNLVYCLPSALCLAEQLPAAEDIRLC
jgi:hypothetical protein